MAIDLKTNKEDLLPSPHDMILEEHSRDELMHWRALEFEVYEKDERVYLIAVLILAAIIVYALVSNNPITAITFILIGVVGYFQINKEPRNLEFRITVDGVEAGKDVFSFEDIRSFWIFYEPPFEKILSLRMKGSFLPFIHIPVGDENPVEMREKLLQFIPEVKQKKTLVDIFERILHL